MSRWPEPPRDCPPPGTPPGPSHFVRYDIGMSNEREHGDPPRRGFFLKFCAGLVGGIVGLFPVITAGGFLLGPILKKSDDGDADSGDGFMPLDIKADALPLDGPPQQVTVVADRVDAWNFYPQERVGSVWLRRTADGIVAFNTICPHLGCSVDYRTSHEDFYCPCHLSNFSLDGERQNMIPPRSMDSLETKIVDDRVWVKFENYRGGIEEKVPV